MPINKNDILNKIKETYCEQLVAIEKKIDAKLAGALGTVKLNNWNYVNSFELKSIEVDVQEFNESVIGITVEKYKKLNWCIKVDKGDNQKDGYWYKLIFS